VGIGMGSGVGARREEPSLAMVIRVRQAAGGWRGFGSRVDRRAAALYMHRPCLYRMRPLTAPISASGPAPREAGPWFHARNGLQDARTYSTPAHGPEEAAPLQGRRGRQRVAARRPVRRDPRLLQASLGPGASGARPRQKIG